MTRGDLKRLTRTLLDEIDQGYLEDTDAAKFGLNDAVFAGYSKTVRELKATRAIYGVNTIASQWQYELGAFGAHATSLEQITAYEAANPAVPYGVIAGQPAASNFTADFRIALTFLLPAGGAFAGCTVTVTGRTKGGRVVTASSVFPAVAVVPAATPITQVLGRRLSAVTAIAQTGALVGAWTRAAGTFADAGGDRVFDPVAMRHDTATLPPITVGQLEALGPSWRWDAAGTPSRWALYDDRHVAVLPAPATGAVLMRLEGFETPDPYTFANDADEPMLHADDHELIALWAAMYTLTQAPHDENQMRATALWPRWQAGLQAAYARINKVRGKVVRGKRQQTPAASEWYDASGL
jgi:hypothetical protein